MNSVEAQMNKERLEIALKVRREKLERIKQFIPLKTYNQISEKLLAEQELLLNRAATTEKAIEKEQGQVLPVSFFEQRFLRPKLIRID